MDTKIVKSLNSYRQWNYSFHRGPDSSFSLYPYLKDGKVKWGLSVLWIFPEDLWEPDHCRRLQNQ